MKAIFLHKNTDGTIRSAALRIDGRKVPDTEIWELWEMFQALQAMGYRPIDIDQPDGGVVSVLVY